MAANRGIANSRIIWIDETALNLLYIGKFWIKKSVSRGKFFPHESRSESTIQDKSQIFVGPLIINNDRIKRKNTVIPIYAGASNIGWFPQYVGTPFTKPEAWSLGTL